MTVHLHIDRIVVFDLPDDALSRTQLEQAVQQELSRALTGSVLHGWAGPGLAVPDLPPVSITAGRTGLPAGIANGVAGAIAGLSGGGR